ncbi:MAG: PadR family transcriptional regulator [Micromonosporaceae bacterium]
MRHGDADSGRGHRRGRPRGRGPGGFGFGPPGFGPPFGGPGGFGPGFPFGGGRRGRGGRRNRGDVRSAVLLLISEQPMHGYQLIGEIAERSEGMWRPSAGSVYPVLQQLEDEGLVRIERVEGRRVVHLTEAGTAYVAERSDELGAVFDQVGGSVDDGVMELFGLMQQAGMAAAQVAQAGTPQQVARAHQVLERTRQELYRILADGDQPEAGGGQSETGGDHPEADGDQPETL